MVECLLSVAGDLTDASAAGQLPRDEKQETNMRREAEGRCGPSSEPKIIPGTVQLVQE